jgi:AcrR family transcriptional regulator
MKAPATKQASASRTYSSPLRAEQAEQTRDRIVQAAVDLLSEGDAGDLSMGDVASRAGVSVRTVYRNFATREDLLDGVIGWISTRLSRDVGPPPSTREEYELRAPEVIRIVGDIEPLYRALFATRAGRESHLRANKERASEIGRSFAAELKGMDEEARRRFSALVHLVSSSNAVLFMKDYWELSDEEIGQTLRWAITTLADGARDPKRRKEL